YKRATGALRWQAITGDISPSVISPAGLSDLTMRLAVHYTPRTGEVVYAAISAPPTTHPESLTIDLFPTTNPFGSNQARTHVTSPTGLLGAEPGNTSIHLALMPSPTNPKVFYISGNTIDSGPDQGVGSVIRGVVGSQGATTYDVLAVHADSFSSVHSDTR